MLAPVITQYLIHINNKIISTTDFMNCRMYIYFFLCDDDIIKKLGRNTVFSARVK